MKPNRAPVALAIVAALFLVPVAAAAAPITVIVELDGAPGAVAAAHAAQAGAAWDDDAIEAYRAQLRADQDAFLARLAANGVAASVDQATVTDWDGVAHSFDHRYTLVFNGVSMTLDDSQLAALAATQGVKRLHPNTVLRLNLDHSVPYIRAPEVYGAIAELTPFDDFREGYEGQGIYVAVIDSGIEWSHEMFGADASPPRLGVAPPTAALGSNQKIVYYMPLVDGALDDFGHGTHVSLTIAGYQGFAPGPDGIPLTGDEVALHGVAPQAKLMGYKACNAAGLCLSNDTLTAIEDAASPRSPTGFPKPKAHVINMSLGGSGTPDSATAADSNLSQGFDSSLTGRYVYAGIADTPDAVPVTVAGNICLTVRGSTVDAGASGTGLFGNKAAQCTAKGAIAVVIFNNEPGEMGPVLAPAAVPVFTIAGEAGNHLLGLGFDAAGVSSHTITLGPPDASLFNPGITGFSSRGPVAGEGQIKPDVSAPGAEVLAATTPIGAPAASMVDPTRYTVASGTSMATPHVAGTAALIRQAHPTWSPDVVRAALANTATNPRLGNGSPEADGPGTDDVLSQGGGLIDVVEAIGAKGVMGIAGDGIAAPSILAGHVYPKAPAINTRVTHTESVTVTIRDLSGAGATYALSTANNRGLEIDGLSASTWPASVSVPAGGSATFRLDVTIDGDAVRDVYAGSGGTAPIWIMGYVTAESAGESLRMPFYLKPLRSLPADLGFDGPSFTEVYDGIVPAGDTGAELAADVTFVDVPFEADVAAVKVDGLLEFTNVGGLPDLDLQLIDPAGVVIATSGNAGGPESVEAILAEVGTYIYRVVGWANGPTPFTITSTQFLGPEAPALSAATEWTDASGAAIDFDGDFTLSWQPTGGEVSFEIEESADGGETWTVIAEPGAGTTSAAVSDRADGAYAYRIRGLHPGQIGVFVTLPSDEVAVTVARREKKNITKKTSTAISNVSFTGGNFEFDLAITNQSTDTYLPPMTFQIYKIQSASGTVAVANADNGGSGQNGASKAELDYSNLLGADGAFSPAETSGTRHLVFSDPAAELFTFKAKVWAHEGAAGAASAGAGGGEPAGGAASEPEEGSGTLWILEGTANPLTGTVIVNLVQVSL